MNVDEYLSQRVEDQMNYFGSTASREKKKFYRIQTWIIILGVLVPVVVNLPETPFFDANALRLTTTIFSVSLAILTGLANLKKHGDLWMQYRSTEEMLKRERFLFLTKSGDYSDENAFHTFVSRVESIISDDVTGFKNVVEAAKNAGQNTVEAAKQEARDKQGGA